MRPEHVKRFQREGFRCVNADKSIIAGIEEVAKRFKQDKLFISKDVVRFKEEVNMYVWNEKTGKPLDLYDDVLDALRYAIYSHENGTNQIRTISKKTLKL